MGASATSLWHHLFWAASMLFCSCSVSAVSVQYSGAPAGPGQAHPTGGGRWVPAPLCLTGTLRHANVLSIFPLLPPGWREQRRKEEGVLLVKEMGDNILQSRPLGFTLNQAPTGPGVTNRWAPHKGPPHLTKLVPSMPD
ncbi:hypothetical protein MHYP_G00200080 [Metynnis hypsauchen]